MNSFNHVS